ncbi:MAG TPA: efflux RND transporter periplasmic adaptor subunit [Alphaproteobacteria bacterium]|nr:efflux RND transporter periplasmic adaptor subunit [Alphaproteobacteria bacterium]
MAKRMIVMLIVVGLVLSGIFGFQAFKNYKIKQYFASQGAPLQTVSATPATEQGWQAHVDSVGTLRAVNGADLSSQVSGNVSAIHFESGADVKEGTLLVELTSADDLAKLQSLKANAALAKITYERDLRQLKAQAVSQQTVDTDEQTLKSLEAQVAQQQATVDYKFIRAPFAGRLGIRQVDLGEYLAAGTTIVTLQSLDPIYVDFYLPQQDLDQIKVGQSLEASVDTYPNQKFPGTITAVNPKVDSSTRNVQVRATLGNADHSLLPGMFASVSIDIGAPKRYVTLPLTAITYNPYGSTVYVVDDKGKGANGQQQLVARQTFVTTGATRGDQVAVTSGVKEGEMVVSAGQNKLRNGAPVLIDNTIKPTADANPLPVDQ